MVVDNNSKKRDLALISLFLFLIHKKHSQKYYPYFQSVNILILLSLFMVWPSVFRTSFWKLAVVDILSWNSKLFPTFYIWVFCSLKRVILSVGSVQVNLNSMTMTRPYSGTLQRLFEPALWLNYSRSDHYHSLHCRMHRIQVRKDDGFASCFPFLGFSSV